ncbi:hypothetical protein K488DRAFT_29921, partial [Vararia minispora EC-137]
LGAGPAFTCPACRAVVLQAPVECWAIKKIVYAIGEKLGEKNPSLISPEKEKERG